MTKLHNGPATKGVTLFAFHGKLNEHLNHLEAGSWSQDITHIRNGRYTFRDAQTQLKVRGDDSLMVLNKFLPVMIFIYFFFQQGDVINFWTFVIYKGLGYRQENGEFHVMGMKTIVKFGKKLLYGENKCISFWPRDFHTNPGF